MAKTRSQATPTKSPKSVKKAAASPAAPSPSVKKVKNIKNKKVVKSAPKETTVGTPTKKAAAKEVKPAKKAAAKPAKKQADSSDSTTTTTTTTTTSSIVPAAAASQAIAQLIKFAQRENTSSEKPGLFEDDAESQNLYLQIAAKKYYSSKPNFKPKVIRLSHPIQDKDSIKTCLIVRDLLITTNEQLEKIEAENLPTLKQIVLLKQLKTEYKPYEKRRQLYSEYDLFLVDDALMNTLPTVLGKVFYGSNTKIPLPVRVTSATNPKEVSVVTISNQLNKCLESTYYLPPVGVNVSVKFGSIEIEPKELVQNLNDVLALFDKEALKSVSVKTEQSPSLPLFYTDSLYSEEDVLEEEESKAKKASTDEVKLSTFEKGLLELGDVDEVAKLIGKKMNPRGKKVTGKVTKPKKA